THNPSPLPPRATKGRERVPARTMSCPMTPHEGVKPVPSAANAVPPAAKNPAPPAKSTAPRRRPDAGAKPTAPQASTPSLPEEVRARLDDDIAALRTGSRSWAQLTLDQRARLLARVRDEVTRVAEEWADTASTAKGIEPGHPLRGEEWLAGPYAALVALDAYIGSLRALAKGESPLAGVKA